MYRALVAVGEYGVADARLGTPVAVHSATITACRVALECAVLNFGRGIYSAGNSSARDTRPVAGYQTVFNLVSYYVAAAVETDSTALRESAF